MSVSERFMTAMELPGDLSCKAPIITITGPSQVQVLVSSIGGNGLTLAIRN